MYVKLAKHKFAGLFKYFEVCANKNLAKNQLCSLHATLTCQGLKMELKLNSGGSDLIGSLNITDICIETEIYALFCSWQWLDEKTHR